jgi:hypothetical protein
MCATARWFDSLIQVYRGAIVHNPEFFEKFASRSRVFMHMMPVAGYVER